MMKRLLHAGKLFLLSTALLTSNVQAAEVVLGKDDYINYHGVVEEGDSDKLIKILQDNPYIMNTMLIKSEGGNVIDSIASANLITAFKLNVAAIGECLSACTFLLFSGKQSYVAEGTVVGIHSPYYYANARYIYTEVGSPTYWKLYGMYRAGGMSSDKAIELLNLTFEHKSLNMRFLTEQELKYFGVKILKDKK